MTADTIELGQRFDIAGAELDNFRAAIEGAAESGDVTLALEIAVSLESLWVAQQPQEGARRLEELMEAAGEVSPELHARALRAYAGIVFISGDFERGTALHEEVLEAFRSLGDELAVAHVLHRLAVPAAIEGDYARARALSDESLATHRRHGSRSGEAMAMGVYVEIASRQGRHEEARELALKSASLAGEVGFTWWQVHYLYIACEMCLKLDRLAEAEKWGREGLRLGVEIGNRQINVYVLALLAAAAAAQGDAERSGVLWGALEREEGRGPVGQWEAEREDYRSRVVPDDPERFERGRARGRLLSPAEALEHAAS
jgi:ATP/maltotriose-dependent transcriptional regulator MalT